MPIARRRSRPLSGLGIVLTHLLAVPIFGDPPSGWQIAGSLLVIRSSLLLTTGKRADSS